MTCNCEKRIRDKILQILQEEQTEVRERWTAGVIFGLETAIEQTKNKGEKNG